MSGFQLAPETPPNTDMQNNSDLLVFAHSLPRRGQDEWESLRHHASEVSRLAASFARTFGWAAMGAAAGLLHDAGKASAEFQAYIRGLRDRGGDHSTAGARIAEERYGELGRILAHCIAGHHAGLQDGDDLARRLDPARTAIPDASGWSQHIAAPEKRNLRPTRPFRIPEPERRGPFSRALLIRMLFSSLVDADFLATERFIAEGSINRGIDVGIDVLHTRLKAHLARLQEGAEATPLNALRREILEYALCKAGREPGLFTLTVPTGGGKTLTSLAFALEHARLKAKRRVVYVIPFVAITEQTAAVFRKAVGDDVVLEHHATFDWEEAERRAVRDGGDQHDGLGVLRRAAENWDAPIVVTTAVQFFESLFASRTSRCRKLHNLADSVVVLDEAQTLPTHLLLPCLAALEELTINYGVSVVLCTATQPAVQRGSALIDPNTGVDYGLPLDEDDELAPRPLELQEELRRVKVEIRPGATDDATVAARFAEQPQMLCIVNSRAHARDLFDRIAEQEGAVHLTTLMCPAHRRKVLADLRVKLAHGLPVRLVATSLIEAGVDISFAEVWRASAGVDQIAHGGADRNNEKVGGLGETEESPPHGGADRNTKSRGAKSVCGGRPLTRARIETGSISP